MSELLPIDQLKTVVEEAASVFNSGYKIATGSSVIGAAIALLSDVATLKTLNKDTVLAQLKDLSDAERAELVAAFKAKLVLADKTLEAKVETLVVELDKVVTLAFAAVTLVHVGMSIVDEVKAVFS